MKAEAAHYGLISIPPEAKAVYDSFRQKKPPIGYAAAIVLVCLATIARYCFDPVLLENSPLAFHYLGVFLAALYGGFGPGMIATIFSLIWGFVFYFKPFHGANMMAFDDQLSVVLFVITGVIISAITASIQRTRQLLEKTTVELHDSRAQYRDLFDYAPIAIYRITPEGKILMANAMLLALLGYGSFEDLAKLKLRAEWDGPGSATQKYREQLLRDDEVKGLEAVWSKWDGTPIVVRENVRAVRGAGGKLLYYEGTAEDITEYQQAQQTLRESEERYRGTFENAAVGISHLDEHGRWIRVNQTLCRITGYTEAELLTRPFTALTHPDDIEKESRAFREMVAGTIASYQVEKRCICKGGRIMWALVTRNTHRSAEGKFLFATSIVQDITELKTAQEAVRASQTELQNVIDGSPIVILVKDQAGRFIVVNRTMEALMGRSREELRGKTDYDFLPKERADYYAQNDRQVLETGKPIQYEEVGEFADGKQHIFLASKFPLFDATGKPYAVCSISTDITERKEMEQELERRVEERTQELQVIVNELESFSYSISHDLRAPLRAINGFASLVLEENGDTLNEESRRYLHIIVDNGKMMGRLVDELLAFTRLNRQNVDFSLINMKALVSSVVDERQTSEPPERSVNVTVHNLPEIVGNEPLLRDAIRNLIDNAFKFTRRQPETRIDIGMRRDERGDVFYVRDNGIGFSRKYEGKLFGVFQRLHRQEEYEGTGIGLALVKRIVERHGGTIWAESEGVGTGATFYFTLPARH